MNKRPLYFDYAATTPVDERVIRVMVECLGFDGNFGNPASSSHAFGQEARRSVESARQQVAQLVGAQPEQIVWTSGATESNNLALKGVAQARGGSTGHVITSLIEHKAILDTARQLEESGFAVTWLAPDAEGLISPQAVREALREDTFLVSLMLVNNELGTVNNVIAIGEIVREHSALFHVDAAQGAGKVQIDLSRWPVDLMSFFPRIRSTAPRASGRSTLATVPGHGCRHRFTAEAMKAVCAPGPWRPTRSQPWALRSNSRPRHSTKSSLKSPDCAIVCLSRCWPCPVCV
nr:hypothetical protein GCM10020185_59850 [Pseudomonas brassicacearum subsp. brassicacearum]